MLAHLLSDPPGQLGARGGGVGGEHPVATSGGVHLGETVRQLGRWGHQRPVTSEAPDGHVEPPGGDGLVNVRYPFPKSRSHTLAEVPSSDLAAGG